MPTGNLFASQGAVNVRGGEGRMVERTRAQLSSLALFIYSQCEQLQDQHIEIVCEAKGALPRDSKSRI